MPWFLTSRGIEGQRGRDSCGLVPEIPRLDGQTEPMSARGFERRERPEAAVTGADANESDQPLTAARRIEVDFRKADAQSHLSTVPAD